MTIRSRNQDKGSKEVLVTGKTIMSRGDQRDRDREKKLKKLQAKAKGQPKVRVVYMVTHHWREFVRSCLVTSM